MTQWIQASPLLCKQRVRARTGWMLTSADSPSYLEPALAQNTAAPRSTGLLGSANRGWRGGGPAPGPTAGTEPAGPRREPAGQRSPACRSPARRGAAGSRGPTALAPSPLPRLHRPLPSPGPGRGGEVPPRAGRERRAGSRGPAVASGVDALPAEGPARGVSEREGGRARLLRPPSRSASSRGPDPSRARP